MKAFQELPAPNGAGAAAYPMRPDRIEQPLAKQVDLLATLLFLNSSTKMRY